jgi:hypothetical protein
MEDYFDLAKVKANVYLLKDGDKQNMAMITDEALMIVRDGKKALFQLNIITKVDIANKKMLLPLILGGVLVPFSFLWYFTNMMHPVFHLVAILTGIFLFHAGWNGKAALIVQLAGKEERLIYIPSLSMHVRAFIEYVNECLQSPSGGGLQAMIFVAKRDNESRWLFEDDENEGERFPMLGYTYKQAKMLHKEFSNWVAIDPELNSGEIKFVFDPLHRELRPQICAAVSEKAARDISHKELQ